LFEDPQARLKRVIDQFAAEHRADLDAEDQVLPSRTTPAQRETTPTVEQGNETIGSERELETVSADPPPPERDDSVP